MGIIIPIMGTKKPIFPASILFSKVQQSILKLLYLNKNSDFHTNEIIRLSQSGRGAVQRELEKLVQANFITVKQVGNQKRYQANQALSFYSELRNIIIKTFGLADVLSQELKRLLPTRIKIAFIYGSFAKQTDSAESDIDLMLIGDDLTYADTFPILHVIESSLSRKINPTFYSPVEWKGKYRDDNHFVSRIIEQPKIFLIGTEDELKEYC